MTPLALTVVAVLLGATGSAAQAAQEAPEPRAMVQALGGADELARETARRRLTVAKTIPQAEVVALLASPDAAVVVAAARVLRDRDVALDAVRKLSRHRDAGVRAVVLPIAADPVVAALFAADQAVDPVDLRVAALHQLEDRGQLTDALLFDALRSDQAEFAAAATRLMVFERSPFPLALADQLLELPAARRRLITWLADRPRSRSGPWLLKVLQAEKLDPEEQLLAITSLPPDWLDLKFGRQILAAALADQPELSNRASFAAGRLGPAVADQLVGVVVELVEAEHKPINRLLPCLGRVTTAGEAQLFGLALRAGEAVRREISHWLVDRQSKLIEHHVIQALDGDQPFPPELVSLTAGMLTTPQRIGKVVAILPQGGGPGAEAYEALLEAGVFRPAMEQHAEAGVGDDKARRYSRLFKLPPATLPLPLFQRVLELDDVNAVVFALHALARAPIDRRIEPLVLDLALQSMVPTIKLAASRAIILNGSEAAGRRVWRAQSGGEMAIRWLIEQPKPWSHELLLELRENLEPVQKVNREFYHRVLIALSQLGDRGAQQALFAAIPRLAPAELQQAQTLMGRFYQKDDLTRLARRYLVVHKAGVDPKLRADAALDETSRAELLEWFLSRPGLELDGLLSELWEADESYEVRLVALRGLLARDSAGLHRKLTGLLAQRFSEARQELAFEVVGSMAHPLTDKALDLLARILLLAPLTDPGREIALAIQPGYDSLRGAYPLVIPAANLLRRDAAVTPRAAFAAVANEIGERRFALNRQRLGLLLAGIQLNARLARDLGPVLAQLIVSAPDRRRDYLGPASMILGDAAHARGDDVEAAAHYTAATRAFCRDEVPDHIRRSFFGDVDPLVGYHPYAALAAQAPLCRARLAFGAGRTRDGHQELSRARDLAEGDADTIKQIDGLRRANRK